MNPENLTEKDKAMIARLIDEKYGEKNKSKSGVVYCDAEYLNNLIDSVIEESSSGLILEAKGEESIETLDLDEICRALGMSRRMNRSGGGNP